ncbi:MAG TPA: glycoside hydrolase family 9 protein [Allosphingosinicella sp.]|jgi:endoglucanase|nr:glycoside hydrolase family 9 protein [Allosphingosinicella sp.]
MRFLMLGLAGLLIGAAAPPADPSPIRLNQLGFLPSGAKRAIVPDAANAPLDWRLVDGSGRVLKKGKTIVFGDDPASGEHVHRVDFGTFTAQGSGYRLIVGDRSSRAFAVSPDLYDRLRMESLNYFYQTRAGIPIEARFAGGPQWARPAGHLPEKAVCVSRPDRNGNVWPGCPGEHDVTGGWYDAGDQGKYVVNGGIALWTLLDLYEREQALGRPSPYADGKARLPEAGNGVNDLLDEARWELEFFLKMQAPDGTRLKLPVGQKRNVPGLTFTEIDASGMAYHKVGDEHWTPLPTPPHLDREKRLLFPPSTGATLNLAATMAQCARIWRRIDPAFAARCLTAAERAWAAAKRNPEVYAIDAFPGSGGYGDSDLSDEFYWAAAELYVTTGKADYAAAVRASPYFRAGAAPEPGWPRVATLGTISLALLPNGLVADERAALRRSLVAAADAFLADEDRTGYRIPYAPAGWPWGSTSSILNRAMILALAHDFTGDERYRDGVIDGMDFILGRNPLDRSFVTGTGARPMEHPHHRFWTHQLDPAMPGPPPGVLSGGPNSTYMSDPVAARLKGRCAPETCWADDSRAYSVNEVAINWDAPLVWVSAWLSERPR